MRPGPRPKALGAVSLPPPPDPNYTVKYQAQGPTLAAFHRSDAEVRLVQGPLGSGKTNACVGECFRRIISAQVQTGGIRRSLVLVTRNTYPDLVGTTIRDWRAVFGDELGQFKMDHPPVHYLRFTLDDGTKVESDVVFLALDRPDHVKKLRGYQATFGWMNEAKEQPRAVFTMLRGRCGRKQRAEDRPPLWSGIIADFNAPDDDHWIAPIIDTALAGESPGIEAYIQPGAVLRAGDGWVPNAKAENLHNLQTEEERRTGAFPSYYLKMLQGSSDDWIKVNLANLRGFAIDGKAVHPDFNSIVHVAKELLLPAPGRMITVGLDFGLTPAAAFNQKQATGVWHVLDELCADDLDIVGFIPELQAKVNEIKAQANGLEFEFIGDPAGDERVQTDSETVFRVLRAAKFNVRAAPSNDTTLRRGALKRPLTRMVMGKPGIIVSPKCKRMIKGLAGGFCYKRVLVASGDRYHDKPDKNLYSHIVEAEEYALLGAGENAAIGQQAGGTPQGPVVVSTKWSPFDRGGGR